MACQLTYKHMCVSILIIFLLLWSDIIANSTYRRIHLFWDSQIQKATVNDYYCGKHGNRQADMALEQKLRTYILTHKHNANCLGF